MMSSNILIPISLQLDGVKEVLNIHNIRFVRIY